MSINLKAALESPVCMISVICNHKQRVHKGTLR